ncbi:uncharacterized protein LOC134741397 isoform X1 [Cydia strobilella]|uniref:uncharacterized protein LOC134741397 isoform X1 n=1 Tax=Cydia strobilella TaxID=1100964 RepID=UPI003004496D
MCHTSIIYRNIIMITTSPLRYPHHHVIGKNITIPTKDLLHRRRHTMEGIPDIQMILINLTIDLLRLHLIMVLRLHLIMVLHLRHTMNLHLHRRLHTMKGNPDILMSSVHLTIDLLRLHLIMVLHLRHTMDPHLHRTMVHHLHRTMGLRLHLTMVHHLHRPMNHRLDRTMGLRLHHTMDLHHRPTMVHHLMTENLRLRSLITIITLTMATKPIDNLMVMVHLMTLMTLHPKIVGLHRMAKYHLVQTGNLVDMGPMVITRCNLVLHLVFHPPRILKMNRFFKTLNSFSEKGFIILHRMI